MHSNSSLLKNKKVILTSTVPPESMESSLALLTLSSVNDDLDDMVVDGTELDPPDITLSPWLNFGCLSAEGGMLALIGVLLNA